MTFVTVDVDLTEVDSDDLRAELESRGELDTGLYNIDAKLVEQIYNLYRLDKDYDLELTKLFYFVLGRIA